MKNIFLKLKTALNRLANYSIGSEQQLLMLGKILCKEIASKSQIASLAEVEFKVFSQWGDDGIIQWLIHNIDIPNKTFIEFGVENYLESNTRFLMMNNNWSGLVIDGSKKNVQQIVASAYYWRYDLLATYAFIKTSNINELIAARHAVNDEVGILHVDLDGNDYWIWKEITSINPVIVILEYNSVFGLDKALTVPYDENFQRTKAHSSNLYFGASLRALHQLSEEKGYAFIGCNSAGNNAYFVRADKLNEKVRKIDLEAGYVASKFRECRDKDGRLNYVSGRDRIKVIEGMPVFNLDTQKIEPL